MLEDVRSGFHLDVRPQDDLFGHVNGRWIRETKIPEDLPRWGVSMARRQEVEAQVLAIVEEAASTDQEAGSPGAKMGTLFRAFMDDATVEALGAAPILDRISELRSVGTWEELAELMGRLDRESAHPHDSTYEAWWVHGVWTAYVDVDDRDPSRYVLNIAQGGLTLPDESYYREAGFADTRRELVGHVERTLASVGWPDPHAAAGAVLALESRLAEGHWTAAATRDVLATYNPRSGPELEEEAPLLAWAAWVRGLGGDEALLRNTVVRQPSFLAHAARLVDEVPLEEWKAWAALRVVDAAAPFLSSAFVTEHFAFHGHVLEGRSEPPQRWRRGVAFVQDVLGEAVGEMYVARHFPPAAKVAVERLVADLVAAYRRSITGLDWMGEETRSRALEKLATFRVKLAYSDRFRDYGALELGNGRLVDVAAAAAAFETDRQIAKIGGPVDRDEWLMLPQRVDAYFNPTLNEICFPAGILTPPQFDADADLAENLGGIGSVIGHEIGHAFDDQGALYDSAGVMRDWWTADDRAAFRARTQSLVAQYDALEPRQLPGERVNGALTLGENIGDLVGIGIALQAYLLGASEGRSDEEVAAGIRRLFLNYALSWRTIWRSEALRKLLASDPHSPPEFRTNVVRNVDAFHDAFATKPGDGLWLAPEDRVRIW